MKTIKNYLSPLETRINQLIFISAISYSLWKFYTTSNDYLKEIHQTDLQNVGWISKLTGRSLDVTDLEWQIFKQYFLDGNIFFLLSHSIGFQILKLFHPKHLPIYIILYSTIILGYLLSVEYLILLYLNIGIIFLLECLIIPFKKAIHYFLFIYFIAVMHNLDFVSDRGQNLLIHVSFSWLNAKLLSCSIDSYDEFHDSMSSLPFIFTRIAYLLYFPPFFFGPIYNFSDFKRSIESLNSKLDHDIIYKIIGLFKLILWAFLLEIILHFIYSSIFQYYIYLIDSFDSWSLCGLGYSLMIIFFLKYFVVYGISRQLSIIDGLNNVIAKPPECIAHIYQTSYLWRQFDRGLYLFLIKYFYKPITGSHYHSIPRRLFATFVIFVIIAFWHGYYDAILVWVSLNIFLSYTELFASMILRSKNSYRIKALMGSPLLALAYISNIFFLSNYETGMLFVHKIILQFPLPLLPLLFVLYFVCYVCNDINEKINKK